MNKDILDKIIEDLFKVDNEIHNGTQWSQSVKLNKVIAKLKELREEMYPNESNDPV